MNEEKWIIWKMQTSTNWTDIKDVLKYINIDFIDYDHKHLIEYALKLNTMIDSLEDAFSSKLVEETNTLFHELYYYAVMHFEREEVFMDQYHLPDITEHKHEHAQILKMLKNVLNDFNKGKIKVGQDLKESIMEWLINHINIYDYNYFDIKNWSKNLITASDWNAVKAIIHLTGIKDIDEQHQIFTTMAIEVMQNVTDNPNPNFIHSEFKRFRDYALFHFNYEQEFMTKYAIQETDEHLELHNYFIKEIEAFPNQIIEDPSKIESLKTWVLTWWISHINLTDKETFLYKNWAYTIIEQAKTLEDVSFLLRQTGFKDIDTDHLHLMEVTLELNHIIDTYTKENVNFKSDKVKEEINQLFIKIYDIAFEHFEREKSIMKAHNLRDTQRHLEEHRQILNKFNTIRLNYLNNRLYLSNNIKTMILEWWIEHTNTIDFETFVQYFDQKETDPREGGGRSTR